MLLLLLSWDDCCWLFVVFRKNPERGADELVANNDNDEAADEKAGHNKEIIDGASDTLNEAQAELAIVRDVSRGWGVHALQGLNGLLVGMT